MNKLQIRKLYIVVLLIGNLLGVVLNLLDSESVIQSLSYFTIQSNLLVFSVFLYILLKKGELSTKERSLKAATTIAIMLTFLVYHTLLDPFFGQSDYNPPFLQNFLVHTYTPLLVLLDYFLFDKKGVLEYRMIPIWLSIPIFYFVYANVYAILGGTYIYEESITRYPYFFMNPDIIGWGYVILFIFTISVLITILSWLYVKLDKKIVEEKQYHDREIS